MDWLPINWAIAKHPLNWVIITLMVIIGMFALNLVLSPWHVTDTSSDQLNENSTPGPFYGSSILNPMQ